MSYTVQGNFHRHSYTDNINPQQPQSSRNKAQVNNMGMTYAVPHQKAYPANQIVSQGISTAKPIQGSPQTSDKVVEMNNDLLRLKKQLHEIRTENDRKR